MWQGALCLEGEPQLEPLGVALLPARPGPTPWFSHDGDSLGQGLYPSASPCLSPTRCGTQAEASKLPAW